MRKYLLPGVLVLVVIGACAHPTPPAGYGPTTPAAPVPVPTSAAAADQTATVCAEAKALSSTDAATIRTKANAAAAAVSSGDQAGLLQAVSDLKSIAADWADQLTRLAAQPVRPAVKAVLDDGAATIRQLAAAVVPPPDAEAKLAEFVAKLSAACG